MKATTTEQTDTDAGTVDPVPPAELDTTPAPRRRGRPAGSRNKPREDRPAEQRPTGRPSNNARLAKSLESQYLALGGLCYLFAPATGQALIANAESCADSLAAWAATNPKIAKALERTVTGAGAVSVLAAHAPIALAVYMDVQSRTGRASLTVGDDAGAGAGFNLADLLGSMPPAA
jgi:hypothetical protein